MSLVTTRSTPRRGVAAVEFALILPFLLCLLLGVWEVGRMIQIDQVMANAAREGGREAATGLLSSSDVQQVVINYLNDAGLPTQNAVVSVTNATSGQDPMAADQLDQFQVSVNIPFQDVRWIALYLVTTSTTKLYGQATWYSLRNKDYPSTVTPPSGS